MKLKNDLITFWLDFVNDFLTVEKYAEFYNLTVDETESILKLGKKLNES